MRGGMRGVDHADPYGIISRMNTKASFRGAAENRDDEAGILGPRAGLAVKDKTETRKPSLYKVYLLNDDYTPMDFVVQVLEAHFNKSRWEAMQIMLHVHRRGAGLCGVFTYEVAETKVVQVMEAARRAEHPLQCTMEKE